MDSGQHRFPVNDVGPAIETAPAALLTTPDSAVPRLNLCRCR